MKSPYSLEALIEAFETLFDTEPEYDEYLAMVDPQKAADEIWQSLEDWSRKEIREYES